MEAEFKTILAKLNKIKFTNAEHQTLFTRDWKLSYELGGVSKRTITVISFKLYYRESLIMEYECDTEWEVQKLYSFITKNKERIERESFTKRMKNKNKGIELFSKL